MGSKILIVEDDFTMQGILSHALCKSNAQIKVDLASSAEQAIHFIQGKQNYDLIVCDVFLTGALIGLEIWQKCELISPGTPILLISGIMGSQEFFSTIGNNLMAPSFLSRPVALKDFRKVTEDLIEESKLHPFAA